MEGRSYDERSEERGRERGDEQGPLGEKRGRAHVRHGTGCRFASSLRSSLRLPVQCSPQPSPRSPPCILSRTPWRTSATCSQFLRSFCSWLGRRCRRRRARGRGGPNLGDDDGGRRGRGSGGAAEGPCYRRLSHPLLRACPWILCGLSGTATSIPRICRLGKLRGIGCSRSGRNGSWGRAEGAREAKRVQ